MFFNYQQQIFEIAVKRRTRRQTLDCEITRQLIFDPELYCVTLVSRDKLSFECHKDIGRTIRRSPWLFLLRTHAITITHVCFISIFNEETNDEEKQLLSNRLYLHTRREK